MTPELEAFRDRDSTAEFDCLDCGAHVISFAHRGPPICAACRFIRENPSLPEDVRARLRAADLLNRDEEETER